MLDHVLRPFYALAMTNHQDNTQPWVLNSDEVAFQTPWFTIRKQQLTTPTGAHPTFYIHDTNDSVMCVCVTDDNRVLLERQYRPAIGKVSVDYPAGKMESDDASVEAAMLRELKEETGYAVTSFKKLAAIDKDPGFSTTKMHVYLAEGAIPGEAQPEDTESIHAEFVAANDVLGMITDGTISCAYCVSATLLAFRELGWLQTSVAQR